MSVSLASLVTPVSQQDAETTILGILADLGFPTDSWQTASFPRSIVNMLAFVYSDWTSTIAQIAQGGLLSLSTGAWLDLLAASAYQLTRDPALSTVLNVKLTDGGGGPFTITIGQLTASDGVSGHLYQNTTAGTLTLNGTLDVTFQAVSPGADYNVGNNSITTLVTPLAGVTCTNVEAGGGGGSSIISAGTDLESDASLVNRCTTQWGALGTGGAANAYISWATTGAPTITRVLVDDSNPGGPGTVYVYIANAAGGASDQEVADADAYIQARKALTATVTTIAATNVVINVTATQTVKTAFATAALTSAQSAIRAYINSADIGGAVYVSELISAIAKQTGVVNVTLSVPALDVTLLRTQVAQVGSITINQVLV